MSSSTSLRRRCVRVRVVLALVILHGGALGIAAGHRQRLVFGGHDLDGHNVLMVDNASHEKNELWLVQVLV